MPETDIDLAEAYRAANPAEAHVIQIALEDAGITSKIDGEDLQGSEYPLGWSTAPRILVAESQVTAAREIISCVQSHRDLDNNTDSDLLRCLACGHTMGATENCSVCGWTYKAEA